MSNTSSNIELEPMSNTQTEQKTICIVQITRIGDTVQTLQAANLLKKENPQLRLIFVGREKFAKPLMFLLDVTFDKCIMISSSNDSLSEINNENIDVTVNLSFCKESSNLCARIKSTHKLGLQFRDNGSISIPDKWSQLIYASVMRGPLNPFSLVDLFCEILGVKKLTIPSNTPKPQMINAGKNIAIHPFASHEKKRWKLYKWVEVIYKLLHTDSELTISLFGSQDEQVDADELIASPTLNQYRSRIFNYVGKTTIYELTEKLEESMLFVGHDSMIGHLATLSGIQTLTISLGCVRPIETTPYGEGNYNIVPKSDCFPCFVKSKCPFYKCHTDVSYKVVVSAIIQLLEQKQITREYLTQANSSFHLAMVNFYITRFSNQNWLKLESIIDQELKLEDIFKMFYRITWPYLFSEIEEYNPYPKLTTSTHKQLLQYLDGLRKLNQLMEFGKKYSQYIYEELTSKTPNLREIKEFSAKIEEIDQLQNVIKKEYPLLSPLLDFFTVAQGNLEGEGMTQLTESSYLTFTNSSIAVKTVIELLRVTINKHSSSTGNYMANNSATTSNN
ncbi:MAG: glycosyltransferase family 9 protein [Bacteriovoracaceae bacterium]|nr:glycosyltransferase family 9 protein [Bacteriovoracaceae bacterium]